MLAFDTTVAQFLGAIDKYYSRRLKTDRIGAISGW